MDKDDIIYAERILEILKGKPRIISNRLYEIVHYEFKGQPRKQLQNYDHILKALEILDLIETDSLGANRKQVFLLEKGMNTKSSM